MDDRDRGIIQAFAGGDKSQREPALAIYRKALGAGRPAAGNPYLSFMSEIDNDVPDLALRALYRQAVLA